jgi:hypothetical protein
MKKLLFLLALFLISFAHGQDIKLNGTTSAENNQIKNIADPTDAQDAVTKAYIESIENQLSHLNEILQNSGQINNNIISNIPIASNAYFGDIIVTSDNHFVLIYAAYNYENDIDIFVTKLDENKKELWTKNYGSNNADFGFGVVEKNDKTGFIIIGRVQEASKNVSQIKGESDVWVAEINNDGDLLKERALGGSYAEWPTKIIKTNDTYTIMAKSDSYDDDVTATYDGTNIWVFEIGANFDLIKEKTFGTHGVDEAKDIVFNAPNTLFIGANIDRADMDVSEHFGAKDMWVASVNWETTSINWEESIGTSRDENLKSLHIVDDFIYVSGFKYYENYSAGVLYNISAVGGILSNEKFEFGNTNVSSWFSNIISDDQNNLYLTGLKSLNGFNSIVQNNSFGGSDIVVLKLDNELNILWEKVFGGSGEEPTGFGSHNGIKTVLNNNNLFMFSNVNSSDKNFDLPFVSNGSQIRSVWLTEIKND